MRKMRKSQLTLTIPNEMHANVGNFNGDANSESYSSTSTFSETYSDSSDLANWEEYVGENGTLFYAEYSLGARRPHEKRIEFSRNSSLRLGKKNATRKQQQQKQQQQAKDTPKAIVKQDEPKFSHIRQRRGGVEQQQQKFLELVITAADRYRFGRRSTAVESILGFRVVPFSDQPECLMVDSFVHDMPAMQQQQHQSQSPPIKRGDWFKSLDDIEVRTSNVDELLLQFVEPTKVCLKFQGPTLECASEQQNAAAASAATAAGGLLNNENGAAAGISDLRKIENFAMFADIFAKLQLPAKSADANDAFMKTPPFLLLILPPECYQNERHKDSLYYYPEPAATNFLYKSRGSFLTLNAVLGAEMQTKPLSSQLIVEHVKYHVCYRSFNSFLVLFAYAATYQSMLEANLRTDELIAYMRFTLPSLSLEHLCSSNNEATISLRNFLQYFCEIQRTRILAKSQIKDAQRALSHHNAHNHCLFEELLQQSRSLPLPKEAQLRIFDALSEMEAMDYRNWNDEPLNTHREFFIHGSVLYYDNFLLAAQLPLEMRARIESFLRCRGIFDFITDYCVKEFYAWEEIMPPELCEQAVGSELGRYFLTICSRSHLILAVVLKIFDAPDLAPDAVIPPSLFYIEEIQETLDHLISCGIESLAMFWSISNKRPETLVNVETISCLDAIGNDKECNKLENFIKQKLTPSTSGSTTYPANLQRKISYDEETHMCSSLGGSSIHSLSQSHSEDDGSRKRLNNNNTDNVSDSGSDWDNFGEQNPLHYGIDAELQSQMTESLWKEINNVVPVKISAGWKNSIFYYVYVDNANGTVFCPLKPTNSNSNNNNNNNNNSSSSSGNGNGSKEINNKHLNEFSEFLSEIRKACLIIHNVLQNTKKFRRQLAQEPNVGKSSSSVATSNTTTQATSRIFGLAIKEHGLTIQVRESTKSDDDSGEHTTNALLKGSFVVVGRLFQTPTREILLRPIEAFEYNDLTPVAYDESDETDELIDGAQQNLANSVFNFPNDTIGTQHNTNGNSIPDETERHPSEVQKAVCTITAGEVRASAEAVTTKTLKGVCGSAELQMALGNLETKIFKELQALKELLLLQQQQISATKSQQNSNCDCSQNVKAPKTQQTPIAVSATKNFIENSILNSLNDKRNVTIPKLKSLQNHEKAENFNNIQSREKEVSKFNNSMLADRDFKIFTYYWRLENFTKRIENEDSLIVDSPRFSIKGKPLRLKAYFQHLHRDFLYIQLEYATTAKTTATSSATKGSNNIMLDMGLLDGVGDGNLFKAISSNDQILFKYKISILDQKNLRSSKDLVSQEFHNLESGFLIPNSALLGSPFVKNDTLLVQLFLYL